MIKEIEVEYNSGKVDFYENVTDYKVELTYIYFKNNTDFGEREIYIPIFNVKQIWVIEE